MLRTFSYFAFALLIASFTAMTAPAQFVGADMRTPNSPRHNDDFSNSVVEKREQMRIEKEKKEFAEMLGRGEETVKLADRLARSYAENGHLTGADLSSLETVEKNVKKIRGELGGGDDDESLDEVLGKDKLDIADAVSSLKETTSNLFDELKKTSRFNISAAAIESSNAAITIVHFLRFGK